MARKVTVRVPLEESLDLLEHPTRACVGFTYRGRPRIEPVTTRYENGRYLVAFDAEAVIPHPSDEMVLVIDDGVLFFELRAVYVRGRARPTAQEGGSRWIEVEPSRVSSWNYGRMRWDRDID